MADCVRQMRYSTMLKDNVEKIIDQGIRFNLKKLDACSRKITKVRIESLAVF